MRPQLTPGSVPARWVETDRSLSRWLEEHLSSSVEAYRLKPLSLDEHANQEESFRTGGYSDRTVLELLQNAADALHRGGRCGRVEFRLQNDTLYCANEGAPLDARGLEAITHAFLSDKRGEEMGRFGLGFKSVLAFTDAPAVFSRTISLRFGPQVTRNLLGALASERDRLPVLRLPAHVDLANEMSADPTLAALAEWADTIVKLPLQVEASKVAQHLDAVPPGFLLFAPSVDELHFTVDQHEESPERRVYRCTENDGRYLLSSREGHNAEWIVRHREHRPSAESLAEVGEVVSRESVTVSYAAPIDEAQSTGRFWAYFPLTETTSVRGILNAPWRINDDRTSMLAGKFNDELLGVATELIIEVLPELSSAEDPARHFDYMPARGRESPNHADRYLTSHVPPRLAATPCVPDAEGTLCPPRELRILNPDTSIELAIIERWNAATSRPRDTAHPACYRGNTRRARLRGLLQSEDGSQPANELSPASWISLLVPALSDEQCRTALSVIATVQDHKIRSAMRHALILPDRAGRAHRLDDTLQVFLRGDMLTGQAGLALVRESLLDLPGVESILRSFGFTDVEPIRELTQLLGVARRGWRAGQWETFWELVANCNQREVVPLLVDEVLSGETLRVRGRDGGWHDLGSVVATGMIEPRNAALTVDEDFYQDYEGILAQLGLSATPRPSSVHLSDLVVSEYRREMRQRATGEHPRGRRTKTAALQFAEKEALGPLYVLRRFDDTKDIEAQARWSRALLESPSPTSWHAADPRDRYKTISCPAPHLWAVRRFGLLETAWGPRRVDECISPSLVEYGALLPVAECHDALKLDLVGSLERIPPGVWQEFLGRRPPDGTDPWRLGQLLEHAVRAGHDQPPPMAVPALQAGLGVSAVPEQLLLAVNTEQVGALQSRALPFVAVSGDTEQLEAWGCRRAETTLRVDIIAEPASRPVVLLDRFQGLRPIAGSQLHGFELIDCHDLAREITVDGVERRPARIIVDDQRIYRLETVSDDELLEQLSEQFVLGLNTELISRILQDAQQAEVEHRIAACRMHDDPAGKLRRLLPTRALRARLPGGLIDGLQRLGEQVDDSRIAQLLVDTYSYDVLFELRHDLKRAGLPTPDNWSGSPPAVAFVQRLGFARQYAGQRGRSLEPEIVVPGPDPLSELHRYQKALASEIRNLVTGPNRAIVSLPTGAGKTRVAVEALIGAIVEDGLNGPILWIAQTEELCEQAVSSWRRIWPQRGARYPLRIGRLWGGREVAEGDDEATVVVATEAKLLQRLERADYAWLSRPGVVIIDEAHVAMSKSYTRVLSWLGIDAHNTSRPLLGLTATPFRGGGDEANKQLANRFGARILDTLGDDPYATLQRMEVLSSVTFRELEGRDWDLEADEIRQTERMGGLLPPSVLERLGRDEERNHRLLVDIERQPKDRRILVFTASVLAAQTLAALLKVRGTEAAAVSGSTRGEERRRLIEGFRVGRPRVLINCAVLTQGFDAPQVEALYIARPTFSPAAYIQMVGRGLRGPLNGGSRECEVINIRDTFQRFGQRLAYQDYDHLWRRSGQTDPMDTTEGGPG